MKNRLFVILFLLFVSFLPACKKDSSNTNTNTGKTKMQLITTGSWKQISEYYSGAEHIEDCNKDDRIQFYSDSTSLFTPGATICYVGEPVLPFYVPWEFTDNETKVVFDGDTGVLNELTESALTITFIDLGIPKTLKFDH